MPRLLLTVMNEYVSSLQSSSIPTGRKKWGKENVGGKEPTCNSQYTCCETSWLEFASFKLYCSRRSGANRKRAIKIVPSIRRPGTNSDQNYVSKLDIPGHCAGIIETPAGSLAGRMRAAGRASRSRAQCTQGCHVSDLWWDLRICGIFWECSPIYCKSQKISGISNKITCLISNSGTFIR